MCGITVSWSPASSAPIAARRGYFPDASTGAKIEPWRRAEIEQI